MRQRITFKLRDWITPTHCCTARRPATSIDYRSHRTHWPGSCARRHVLPVPPTNLRRQLHWLPIRQRITYKIAVITYKTRSTGTPAYLSHLINDYLPSRTLRSSDKLLLVVPRMSPTMSAKAFSVSAPSVWNNCRSAEWFSTLVVF